jgi:glutathione S-transferase
MAAAMPTLYWSPGACSLAPHILLEEAGMPYRRELVWSRDGRMTNTPAWRAVNPKGRIPALHPVPGWSGGQDGLLTELPAIMVHIAMTFPEVGMLPDDPAAFVRCVEWMNWLSGAVHTQSYGQIWRPERFTVESAHYTAVQAQGRRNLLDQHAQIEAILSDGRQWAIPECYSIVDPYLLVFYIWGQRIGLEMNACMAWRKITQRVLARAAVQRVLAFEAEAEIAA